MEPILWPIVLLIVGLVLIALELFVPSGGLLSVLAAVSLVSSIVTAFFVSVPYGVTMMAVHTLVIPLIVAIAIRWWPHTPIGRLILIRHPDDPDDLLPNNEQYRGLMSLIGRRGISKSKMMPGGVVQIGKKSYDATTEGMPIEGGQAVEVVQVRLQRLVVRPAAGLPPAEEAEDEDLMSRPIDSLGLDDFEDPLE